jgi:hypothetical protein
MDLVAQSPFGPNAQTIAHDQHPHHQFRVNRGATDGTVKGLQVRAYLLEIEKSIDPLKQMIGRDGQAIATIWVKSRPRNLSR